jgi:hypothetical protein
MYKCLNQVNNLLFNNRLDSFSKVGELDSGVYKIQRLLKKIISEKRFTVFQNHGYMNELFDYFRQHRDEIEDE